MRRAIMTTSRALEYWNHSNSCAFVAGICYVVSGLFFLGAMIAAGNAMWNENWISVTAAAAPLTGTAVFVMIANRLMKRMYKFRDMSVSEKEAAKALREAEME
jgi:hypothetical protein